MQYLFLNSCYHVPITTNIILIFYSISKFYCFVSFLFRSNINSDLFLKLNVMKRLPEIVLQESNVDENISYEVCQIAESAQ